MVGLGLLPKMGMLVESVPQFALGGAGRVMFEGVGGTSVRMLAQVDVRTRRHNLYIVAIAIGTGTIAQVAPRRSQQLPHPMQPLLESGILLTAIAAVALNLYFNGGQGSAQDAAAAARVAEVH